MSIRGQSNNRLRTVWSSEMDLYFISLMLEQVSKRSENNDNSCGKWGWVDMMSEFNGKFKFQYEIDILKNRHKVLRNLYRAVKHLLNQKGFSWDNDCQMVTADNNVWDDYIKVHPDARSFRIKTIPYYKDLCVIYGNLTILRKSIVPDQNAKVGESITVSETGIFLEDLDSPNQHSSNSRENASSAITPTLSASEISTGDRYNTMIEEDNVNSISTSTDYATPWCETDTDSNKVRCRTIWQPPMDRFFIDLMVDHVQKGNQNGGLFPKQVWMEMANLFNAKFGFKYDIEILKNRYKTMGRQYKLIKNLLTLDGFTWDETRQMVAADDSVWQDYIKTQRNVRRYIAKPVPYYKELCIICRDLTDNRRDNHSWHNFIIEDDVVGAKSLSPYRGIQSPEPPEYSEDQVNDVQESHVRVFGQKDKRDLENPCGKRARNGDDNVISSRANKKNDALDSSSFSVENVVEAIQSLPEMDEDLILDACDFLEDEKKAKMFLALDFKLRKKWLLRKLRP